MVRPGDWRPENENVYKLFTGLDHAGAAWGSRSCTAKTAVSSFFVASTCTSKPY